MTLRAVPVTMFTDFLGASKTTTTTEMTDG
jgi:hypothetical protein